MDLTGNLLLFLLTASSILYCESTNLKSIRDEELMDLIKSDTYVVVLFSTKNCGRCDSFETALTTIEEELQNTLNSGVVKVINSQLTRLYSPTREPILVFFRHGVPLLYNGPPNDELILHTFLNNKEPVVKELTDATFEHLTQAATGATTGDWFIMFYTSECVDCHRLQARLEAVGAQLRNRLNVARINKALDGSATARRFNIVTVPTFIFFHHGKMYRYQIQKYDVSSFVSFIQDWYKNMKPERIPLPKTPFDEFVDQAVDYLRQNSWLWELSFYTFICGLLIAIFIKFSRRRSESTQKPPSKKEKEK